MLSLVWILVVGFAIRVNADPGTVTYAKTWMRGVPVHVITADLNSPDVKVTPAVARHGVGTSEGFGSMLSRLRPAAAVTGTFFCMRTLVPVGDIVIDGRLVNSGSVGTPVCFTEHNEVVFSPGGPSSNPAAAMHPALVATGPMLVRNGVVRLDPRSEGFRDGALYRKAARTALGITSNNKLILVAVTRPIYLRKLAHIMLELGTVNAANLDGGGSTALYHKGRVLTHPGRRLTNLVVIYETTEAYAKAKPRLAPSPVVSATSSKS